MGTHLENVSRVGSSKQRPELVLVALLRVEQREHDQVHAAHNLLVPRVLGPGRAEAVVVDDDARAGLERRDQVLQDLDGVGGRVVVDDPAEVVD